jgi:hypothetical protein
MNSILYAGLIWPESLTIIINQTVLLKLLKLAEGSDRVGKE